MNKGRFRLIPLVVAIGVVGCGGGGSGSAPIETIDAADSVTTTDPVSDIVDITTDPVQAPLAIQNLADTLDNAQMYANSNNSALLSGPVVGTGQIDTTIFPRQLTLDTGVISTDILSIEAAFAVRREADDDDAMIITVVRNITDQVQCGDIQSVNFTLADGSRIRERASSFTMGSLSSQNFSVRYDRSCLPPNGMAYAVSGSFTFSNNRDALTVDKIVGIDSSNIQSISVAREPYEESILRPVSYTVTPENMIEVLVENRGNVALQHLSLRAIALDANGIPVGYDTSNTFSDREVDPGEIAVMLLNNDFMNGSSSTLRFVAFGNPVVEE